MTIERRAQALLDIVDADRRERVATIVREADATAAALLREAHRQARSRVRAAFVEERRLRDERVHAARANLQTKRRLTAQRRAAALLAQAWIELPAALLVRWRAADSRRLWVAHVVAQARSVLARDRWSIDHAADWPPDERETLVRHFVGEPTVTLTFRPDAAIRAGLRISGSGTVIDGTLDELLGDRAANAARLLACLESEEARA